MSRPPGIAAGRKWTAPDLAVTLSAGCVAWAYPDDLPPWRAIAIVVAGAGSGLLAASLVLMVRAPRLSRLFGGLEPMYRWHHRSGTIAYVLLLGHPLALAIDGLSESPQTAWGALAPRCVRRLVHDLVTAGHARGGPDRGGRAHLYPGPGGPACQRGRLLDGDRRTGLRLDGLSAGTPFGSGP